MNYKDPLEPFVNPIALQITNRDHDDRLRAEGVSIAGRVRNAWNPEKMARRGVLTDKRIRHYIKLGYYTAEFKEARRKLMQRKVAHIKMNRAADTFIEKRIGNFIEQDGRLIYSP